MTYIALDIGGTNVRFSYTDKLNMKDLKYCKKPFVKIGNPHLEVEENICYVINNISDSVKGIGISLAAVMDRSLGKVKTWNNNPCWNHYDLINHLRGKYNVPIIVEDDANCGAIGEYSLLSNQVQNMAYITIGTGIGCGLILNGTIFLGENGFAGELGHIHLVNKNGQNLYNCDNEECFQNIASCSAVLKEYNLLAKSNIETIEQIYALYERGNNYLAERCISNMINNISMSIYNLAMCMDISIFVIGGGVSNVKKEFILQIENNVNKKLNFYEREIFVRQAQMGEYSGVYGALQLLKISMSRGRKKY